MIDKIKLDSIKGLSIAFTIVGLWSSSLIFLLSTSLIDLPFYLIPPAILWQTFLYTGLFITAHDAMHGTVYPLKRKINNFIGSTAVVLYALFSYSKLKKKHWEHHENPASENDPDFHDEDNKHLLYWYIHFMRNYLSLIQITGMTIVFNILHHLFLIPFANLILFWIIPSLLSTLQLFYFGTYLPHRQTEQGYSDKHHTRSNNYPKIISFFTCYHFGYHWEHHEYPGVPWWRLPKVRRSNSSYSKKVSFNSVIK